LKGLPKTPFALAFHPEAPSPHRVEMTRSRAIFPVACPQAEDVHLSGFSARASDDSKRWLICPSTASGRAVPSPRCLAPKDGELLTTSRTPDLHRPCCVTRRHRTRSGAVLRISPHIMTRSGLIRFRAGRTTLGNTRLLRGRTTGDRAIPTGSFLLADAEMPTALLAGNLYSISTGAFSAARDRAVFPPSHREITHLCIKGLRTSRADASDLQTHCRVSTPTRAIQRLRSPIHPLS
jgi:hypothetical protein